VKKVINRKRLRKHITFAGDFLMFLICHKSNF